jgi:MoaA/NifB/PqqE/SkfB family radical SAM enzyme
MKTQDKPFSLAYQITQKCAFACDICHRNYTKDLVPLTPEQRYQMVDILKEHGIRRLTVTGGEPTMLGEELFDFLKYIHNKQIHVCLSTNGYQLNKARIEQMDEYVDQLLLPIRSLTRSRWREDFGADASLSEALFETVINLLQWIKTTGIILEVSTVVHKKNLNHIIDLGWQLVSLNPNIVWRIEEYYSMGYKQDLRSDFEILDDDFAKKCNEIAKTFSRFFRRLSFSAKTGREKSPDYLIAPDAKLIKTSNHQCIPSQGNIIKGPIPDDFQNRRSWSSYLIACRDWGWGDFSY